MERNHFSDAIGTAYLEYLDVVPQGAGVRVRLIRVSSSPGECGGSVVEAVERIVPNVTVSSLASRNLCALEQQQVDAARVRKRIAFTPERCRASCEHGVIVSASQSGSRSSGTPCLQNS